MSPIDALQEIQRLTADLISTGLCVDQNFPKIETDGSATDVTFGDTSNLSITLKNIPYEDSYAELKKNRSYNIRMIDGALIQILYRFDASGLRRHRLAFFPSPTLLEYQNESEIYEDDELYADILDRNIVTSPIRFDFDPGSFVDYDHPNSHLTIGQYRHCRIPVSGPVSPFIFLNFILRSFYNTPFKKFCGEINEGILDFGETITALEKRHLHVRMSDTN